MLLKRLIEYLPVSRRKYAQALENITKIMAGLIEAEANHCQIEVGLIQAMQGNKMKKAVATKDKNNRNDVSYS